HPIRAASRFSRGRGATPAPTDPAALRWLAAGPGFRPCGLSGHARTVFRLAAAHAAFPPNASQGAERVGRIRPLVSARLFLPRLLPIGHSLAARKVLLALVRFGAAG